MTRTLAGVLLAVSILCGPGCRSFDQPGGELTVTSYDSGKALSPAIVTAVYKRTDANTAELYFSDLPEERLTDPRDLMGDAAGSVLHIHYFLNPDAGNTPIDDTACNVTIKHLVLVGGGGGGGGSVSGAPAFGVYGGGGFFFPSGSPGSTVFGGAMRDGTHRLVGATPGFTDALGPAEISGKMLATRDDDAADLVERKIKMLLRRLPRLDGGEAGGGGR